MRTVARRISKLEERFAARRDERGRTLFDVLRGIRERRHRRLVAEGREPEEVLPLIDAGNRPRSLSETMRRRWLQRVSMEQSV